MNSDHAVRGCARGGVAAGLVILILGIVFLLQNLELVAEGALFRWWPLLLIAVGLSQLFRRYRPSGRHRPYLHFGPSDGGGLS